MNLWYFTGDWPWTKILVATDWLLNEFVCIQTACICLHWVHHNVDEIFLHLEVHRKLNRWVIIFEIILFPILAPYLQNYILMDWKNLDRKQAALSFYHLTLPKKRFSVNSKVQGNLTVRFQSLKPSALTPMNLKLLRKLVEGPKSSIRRIRWWHCDVDN